MLTNSAVENGWVRARKDRLKAHAVSRRQSEVFTALLSHTLSNWHGTDAPRLQHTTTTDNVTIQLLTDAILVNKQTVNGLCLGLPGWAGTKRNIFRLTPILVIKHLLPTSSIYYDPQHPPCSTYVLDSHFPQPLSTSSLVYLLVWNPLLHTPYISSPSHYWSIHLKNY